MEISLGDILFFTKELLRVETNLSGGGCSILTVEEGIRCPYAKFWLSSKGTKVCGHRIIGFTTIVLHNLVLELPSTHE